MKLQFVGVIRSTRWMNLVNEQILLLCLQQNSKSGNVIYVSMYI